MGKRKRKKLPGHFCWSCERRRPNERFSGKGHTRHVCKECQKLGKEELAFRSARNNMERYFTWEGILRKKKRREFEKFLTSSNQRIRQYAESLKEESDREIREMAEAGKADARAEEEWIRLAEEAWKLENESRPSEPEFPTE